jgi:alcohol dehydrogenase (NADP+)
MIPSHGYAAHKADEGLKPVSFERREPDMHDVVIEILFCGICHSDIHSARGEWGPTAYPIVPGHEIVGKVTRVGSAVKKCKVGDTVGVGCMVDTCRQCSACKNGQENYCNDVVWTYGSPEKQTGKPTYGGYSNNIVVDEGYVLRIPANMDLAATAPLLCAGITTYSPLKHWKVGPGMKVGVVGLGGLGHMGLKLARAMGAHVVQFTTSPEKKADALRLGAHEVVISTDAKAMQAHAGTLDFILNTVSAKHDIDSLLALLKLDGTMVLVGLPSEPIQLSAFSVVGGRKSLAGSGIGSIKETQEMLDYCAKHKIVSDIEVIPISKVNEAYERTIKGDVKYRFVIDMASLTK